MSADRVRPSASGVRARAGSSAGVRRPYKGTLRTAALPHSSSSGRRWGTHTDRDLVAVNPSARGYTYSGGKKVGACIVCGRPLPPVPIGRPRKYDQDECRRELIRRRQNVARIAGELAALRGAYRSDAAAKQRQIRSLERDLAAAQELLP